MNKEFIKNMNSIELAEWLHDNYEQISKKNNWETQKNCKVSFIELPKENRQTMINLAERININLYKGKLK